ncbi:hypothetical protein NM208_g6587 [Fusarium decemcellulare]|uniref:Uncharacterized protein n=1 Tax=Fusarium decemcellulare TaxID=57161 RepID=A0ACC1SCD4_9HYPO|nr:hypothetical protein NM208_g6587 [Fusarium decemcellulare]
MSTERPASYALFGTSHGASVQWDDLIADASAQQKDTDLSLSLDWGPAGCPQNTTCETTQLLDDQALWQQIFMTSSTDNFPACLSTMNSTCQPTMSKENNQQDQPGELGRIAEPTDEASSSRTCINLASTPLTFPTENTQTITMPTIRPSASPDEFNSPRFRCTYPECQGLSFEKSARLNEHITRKHKRPFKCPQCPRRFGSSSDRGRHLRTLHQGLGGTLPSSERAWICEEVGCKRNRKPFSRRDNYVKHLREVHDTSVKKPEVGVQVRGRTDGQSEDVTQPVAETLVAAALGDQEGLKRKAGDLEEELGNLSQGELVQLLLYERNKVRRLEEDLKGLRRRCEAREDLWLRVLADKVGRPD